MRAGLVRGVKLDAFFVISGEESTSGTGGAHEITFKVRACSRFLHCKMQGGGSRWMARVCRTRNPSSGPPLATSREYSPQLPLYWLQVENIPLNCPFIGYEGNNSAQARVSRALFHPCA
jgi:hypothetical protein